MTDKRLFTIVSPDASTALRLSGTALDDIVTRHKAGDHGDVPDLHVKTITVSRYTVSVDLWVTTDKSGFTAIVAYPPLPPARAAHSAPEPLDGLPGAVLTEEDLALSTTDLN